MRKATAPAAAGLAIDVPCIGQYDPHTQVLYIATHGAVISTSDQKLEKLAAVFLLSDAQIQKTDGPLHGTLRSAF